MSITVNKATPEFEASITNSAEPVTNLTFLGKVVVLFFYPKDNTPGCTTEAMEFRDRHDAFVKSGAVVLGVSRDNLKSHESFKKNLDLPFELIADTEEKMCHLFGVVKNKLMYGKKVKGIERSTFLLGMTGMLRYEWRGIKVSGHVEEVLKAVKSLKKDEAAFAAKTAKTMLEKAEKLAKLQGKSAATKAPTTPTAPTPNIATNAAAAAPLEKIKTQASPSIELKPASKAKARATKTK